MAKLICGVNEVSNESFNGRSIAQVMETAGPILNIPTNPVILLNGEAITDRNVPLESEDELEFVKPAGEKGSL
jgi:hypothetical protein